MSVERFLARLDGHLETVAENERPLVLRDTLNQLSTHRDVLLRAMSERKIPPTDLVDAMAGVWGRLNGASYEHF